MKLYELKIFPTALWEVRYYMSIIRWYTFSKIIFKRKKYLVKRHTLWRVVFYPLTTQIKSIYALTKTSEL